MCVAAGLLRIPSSTMFDYEWATLQHSVNCRLARAVVVPEVIPEQRLRRYGAAAKLRRYEGLKEEYYLADFEPDAAVLASLGIDRSRPLVVVRTPPEVSLYHRFRSDVFAGVLERLREAAGREGVQAVVLPRVESQRALLEGIEGLRLTELARAYADLVISAGGTMNREAVALGTPVYSTFEGRLGAVDERLIEEGRLRRLAQPGELELVRRRVNSEQARVRRDPGVLVELLLSPLIP